MSWNHLHNGTITLIRVNNDMIRIFLTIISQLAAVVMSHVRERDILSGELILPSKQTRDVTSMLFYC